MDDKKKTGINNNSKMVNVPPNFIRNIITEDIKNNKNDGRVHTRFPPEPNGYLHIGHAKSICLNFGLAYEFNGLCNLRFDDTNPIKEEQEYIDSIMEDIKWLGFDWEDRLYYASDYFDHLYQYAIKLIKDGKAYVDDLNADEITSGTISSDILPLDIDADTLDGMDAIEFSMAAHTHDNRYYTKEEIDNNFYTTTFSDSRYAMDPHTHSDYYNKKEVYNTYRHSL